MSEIRGQKSELKIIVYPKFCILLSVFSIGACQKQFGKLPDFGL